MRIYLICLLLSLFQVAANAGIVHQEMRPGISASAEYLVGERSKPTVLLLHGFLQTREFRTVAMLARGLQDAGYSLLIPTLSLGIPNRKQSLACEAVHRHSLDDDLAEITHWVAWLKSRGHHNIVLVGHSFGSLQFLAYLANKPDPAIKGYIGISLIEAQIGTSKRTTLVADLENRVQQKRRDLVRQPLSFCRNYLSAPDGLLSYVRWDQARTLGALRESPVEARLIMGDSDEMMGRDWIKVLKHVQPALVVVQGANHFMDGEHEFDLLDHTLKHLAAIKLMPR
jgi:pimeloyl-ACP methyl ester carboxylesterase